ncbi:hypothetical protein NHJ13051_002519 [Beauveria bassiana]|uniref:GPI-anchored CFEM domain protein n=1 Tax=Beauveria bassiana TaxID=176275 RepID=A0A2N6NNX4_BEABA|nr:GPI-anchored CFEM domain protein [Beauveria bassiana]
MKFVISLLAAASLVAAQNPLNDIPECAKDCVGQNLSGNSIAGCSQLDYKCVCSNKDFINKIACCLAPVCDDKGKADTIALANRLCKAFNVDLPTAVVCNTGASASSTAASTGSATSSSNASRTTDASTSAGSNGAAASTTSNPNAAPTNVAGIMGAAAALAFAL